MANVVVASIVEFFTLKEAAAQAARLDDAGRKRVTDLAGLAKQRADAAESLWAGGHPAEALRLLVDAFGETGAASAAWLEATGATRATAATPAPAVEEPAKVAEEPPSDAEEPAKASEEPANDSEEPAKASEEPAKASDEAQPSSAAVPSADAATNASSLAAFLTVRGASTSARERLTVLEKDLSATPLPRLDTDVLPQHGDLFDRLTDVRALAARSLADVTLAPRDLTFRRVGRATTVTAFTVFALLGSFLALRTPEGVHARASAHFNEMPDFEPARVLDGNEATSWLLPDRTAGWVDVTINPARTVSRVRVLNTHNTPYNDRASLQYRITLYAGGNEVHAIDGEFEFSASPGWVTHDVGAIDGVDRVRFEVRSWHQHGGGLAEIAIE